MLSCPRHLVLPLVAAVAAASPRAVAAQPSPRQAAEDARVRYESGQRLFEDGNYALAIEEFRAALRLSGRPALWFDIGQAYRLAGDCAASLDAYERYAALDARAAARTNVAERIDEMRTCVAERDADAAAAAAASEAVDAPAAPPTEAAAPAPAAAPAAPPPVAASPLVDVDDGSTSRRLGAALTLGGLVAAGASIALVVRSSGQADALTRRYAWGDVWDADAEAAQARLHADQRRAAIAGAAAGVALAAGLYLYLRGREQGAYARQFTIAPRAGGAEATWSWPF